MNTKLKYAFMSFLIRLKEQWVLEKQVTSHQLTMIHKRNKLMLLVFVILFLLDTGTNYFIFPEIILSVSIMTLVACGTALFFVCNSKFANKGMYAIVGTSFFPFWVVAYVDIDIINYFFLVIPLIMSSVYNRVKPIIMASVLTNMSMIYFYFYYFDSVFFNHMKEDVFYFILFTLFVTIYLIFSSSLNERFLWKAEEREKETSRKLFSTKEYLEAYFNNTTDAIGVYDLMGIALQVNTSFENMFSVKSDTVIGSQTEFLPFTTSDELLQYLNQMKEKKHFSFECGINVGSKSIDASVTVTPVKGTNEDTIALVYLIKDVTDKKRTEEALMQSEKLSVIGELAAGVAHEIRNPVTVLKGFVQLFSQQKTVSDPLYFDIMQKELDRINQITNEFMALAKPQATKMKQDNLIELISQVSVFLESEAFLHQVEIKLEHHEEAIWVDCEANQLKQVFINIIKNGMDAMPQGGGINIQVTSIDGFVHLLIKDDGQGIPKEFIEKLGQPFFTTKEHGTGLGLMVSMKIIENHGGIISIQSEENIGTTVKILLPLTT